MTEPLPKWLALAYAKLLRKSGSGNFTFSDASKWLAIKDARKVGVVLSKLNKAGWLKKKTTAKDKRKKIYNTIAPQLVYAEL